MSALKVGLEEKKIVKQITSMIILFEIIIESVA